MVTITLQNVKNSLLTNYAITVGDASCIDQFQTLFKSQFPDFYWTYYYEEDNLVIGGLPNNVQLPADLLGGKMGDVISVVGNSD